MPLIIEISEMLQSANLTIQNINNKPEWQKATNNHPHQSASIPEKTNKQIMALTHQPYD